MVLNCNKGYYENLFGLTQNAVSSYEKAWQIYQKQKLSNYDIIEFCLKPLGNLYTVLGDYDSAENTIKQYFFIVNRSKNYPDAQKQKFAGAVKLNSAVEIFRLKTNAGAMIFRLFLIFLKEAIVYAQFVLKKLAKTKSTLT